MVRLPLPMVIVGVLVALAAKRFVKEPPGILSVIAAVSLALVLENKGESEMVWLEGELALKTFPLPSQESSIEKLPEVRTALLTVAVDEPLKIQMVWLLLSRLG